MHVPLSFYGPCQTMPAPMAHRGFTLVELVTTIVLIGVLGAIAGPRFFETSPFASRGYADEVASALRVAQKIAVSSGCDVRMTINNSGYSAAQRPMNGGACNTGTFNVPALRVDGSTLSGTRPSDAILSRSLTITFNASGALAPTATSQSFQVGGFTVSVDAVTGLVSVT